MTKALLIDNEVGCLNNLEELLKRYCPEIKICGKATNCLDASDIITLEAPELLFMDIQMLDKSGLGFIEELKTFEFEVVFVTAYDRYAIRAMRLSAVDYLLKPIDVKELQTAVARSIQKIVSKDKNRFLENLVDLLKQSNNVNEHRIALPTLQETRFVKTVDIIRCQSTNNYCPIYLKDGEKILVSKPIFYFDELLSEYGFIRCHQSHLVNKNHIRSLNRKDGGYLVLLDNSEIPVSKSKKDIIKLNLFGK